MKNSILIDIDTERDQPILIGKGQENEAPTTREEAREMILTDISCMCEALITLIHVADQNDYALKEDLVNKAIEQFNLLLVTPNKNEETTNN
jgi:hypothetical protein